MSCHDTAAYENYLNQMDASPTVVFDILGNVVAALRENPSALDCYHQDYRNRMPEPHQMLCLNRIAAWVEDGTILRASIAMPHGAPRDAEHDKINTALHSLDLVSAEFWGGTSDCDGSVSWKTSLAFFDFNGLARPVSGASLPLEVGTTKASVLMWHLGRCAGFARWPYQDSRLLLYVMDRDFWNRWRTL